MVYATPTNNDTAGIYELFTYANTVSEGILVPTLLFTIWIIIFISGFGFGASRSWTASSFVLFVLSLVFSIANLVTPKIMYLFLIFTAVGVLWLKLETQQN